MYDYAKCDGQLRSCLTTPFKFELHFTHSSRTVGSLKVRTQGWKRVVGGGKGVTVHHRAADHVCLFIYSPSCFSDTNKFLSVHIHATKNVYEQASKILPRVHKEGGLFLPCTSIIFSHLLLFLKEGTRTIISDANKSLRY